MISKRIITPPAAPPVSKGEARTQLHLHAMDTSMDEQIEAWIPQATAYVETQSGRRLVPQEWEAVYPCWQDTFNLPFGWLASVESVAYRDAGGAVQDYDAANYDVARLDSLDAGQVILKSGAARPSLYKVEPVIIRFTCGKDVVEPHVKAVILHLIGDYHTYGRVDDEGFVHGLISSFKRYW